MNHCCRWTGQAGLLGRWEGSEKRHNKKTRATKRKRTSLPV